MYDIVMCCQFIGWIVKLTQFVVIWFDSCT